MTPFWYRQMQTITLNPWMSRFGVIIRWENSYLSWRWRSSSQIMKHVSTYLGNKSWGTPIAFKLLKAVERGNALAIFSSVRLEPSWYGVYRLIFGFFNCFLMAWTLFGMHVEITTFETFMRYIILHKILATETYYCFHICHIFVCSIYMSLKI